MRELIISLLGEPEFIYTPNGYIDMVDIPWLVGAVLFCIVVISIFKLIGVVLKR